MEIDLSHFKPIAHRAMSALCNAFVLQATAGCQARASSLEEGLDKIDLQLD
jgi:hypothetical protein